MIYMILSISVIVLFLLYRREKKHHRFDISLTNQLKEDYLACVDAKNELGSKYDDLLKKFGSLIYHYGDMLENHSMSYFERGINDTSMDWETFKKLPYKLDNSKYKINKDDLHFLSIMGNILRNWAQYLRSFKTDRYSPEEHIIRDLSDFVTSEDLDIILNTPVEKLVLAHINTIYHNGGREEFMGSLLNNERRFLKIFSLDEGREYIFGNYSNFPEIVTT